MNMYLVLVRSNAASDAVMNGYGATLIVAGTLHGIAMKVWDCTVNPATNVAQALGVNHLFTALIPLS